MLHKIKFQIIFTMCHYKGEQTKKKQKKNKQTNKRTKNKKQKKKRSKRLIAALEEVKIKIKISDITFETYQRGSSV